MLTGSTRRQSVLLLGTDDVCRVVVHTLDTVMRLSLSDNQIFLRQLPGGVQFHLRHFRQHPFCFGFVAGAALRGHLLS